MKNHFTKWHVENKPNNEHIKTCYKQNCKRKTLYLSLVFENKKTYIRNAHVLNPEQNVKCHKHESNHKINTVRLS